MSISDDGVWTVEALEVRRWKRYGHDRLYVAVPDGPQLGFRDLLTGADHPAAPVHSSSLSARADLWCSERMVPVIASTPGTPTTPGATDPRANRPWRDLARNVPGQSAAEVAAAKRADAPLRTVLDRLRGKHTDERAWRIGAKGERLVADELAKLSRSDPRWTSLHAIPVARRNADIDHLLIGPGGVFSLNTKHHPDATIRVSGASFTVNGHPVPYIHRSEHEARRATRLLSTAVGRPVPVTGVVVPVGCRAPLSISRQPREVYVVTRRDLVAWMRSLGEVWEEHDLRDIWEQARRSTTWVCD